MGGESTVTCDCGAPMTERLNTINNSLFYGCSRFPDCRLTRAVPASVEMRRAGGIELPGFDDIPITDTKKARTWTA